MIAQLAVAGVRLRDALSRLLVVGGRNRAAQVNVAVGDTNSDVSIRERGFVAKRVLDLAFELIVAHPGSVNRGAS